MNSLPLLFSSNDYYRDYNFQRLMRNWNKYEGFVGEETDEMMAEWEEWIIKDFYEGATLWLKKNPNSLFNEEFI